MRAVELYILPRQVEGLGFDIGEYKEHDSVERDAV
jgi:hypothetical protein